MKVLEDRTKVLSYFKDRYGIPEEVFRDVEFLETRKAVWMVSPEMLQEDAFRILNLKKLNFAGIRLLRKTGRSFKPTSYGLQIIGRYATKNIIDLDRESLKALLMKGNIQIDRPLDRGFVVVRYKGLVLGCALLKDNVLYNQFPKSRAEILFKTGLF